jgi:hypothetical protein
VFNDGSYRTINDVEHATAAWVEWYNNQRLHDSHSMLSPTELKNTHHAGNTI